MIPWERRILEVLRAAEARIRLVGTCTPDNLSAELVALRASFGRGEPRAPRFHYRHEDHRVLSDALRRAATDLGAMPDEIAQLYAGRARELALEADMCSVVGTPALAALATERYITSEEANRLASSWMGQSCAADEAKHRSDDEEDPLSLVSRLREAVGRRRIPIRVRIVTDLASLAAAGPGLILVAKGAMLTAADAERIVLHEVEGHALPRLRAHGLLEVGSARGSDDQEGRAIALEQGAGMLRAGRKLELARRHVAALTMREGADFVETVRVLDAPLDDALRIAARAHRGGGLGRELAYLTSYLRFGAAAPAVRDVMARGRVSVEAAAVLVGMSDAGRPYHDEMVMNPAHV